jgi:glycerol-3-phosphate dehydrogenase
MSATSAPRARETRGPGHEQAIECDLLVVGGGINGAGVARDAVGRGLSVVLCEQEDLAAHTSSASTKLIHGGLRYLEQYEFSLVRKALQEREVLLAAAPHIIWPLHFVLPHLPHLRPAWMIRIGLFLYDHLARRKRLDGSKRIDLRHHEAGVPLQPGYRAGFVYSDGWVDDARLVVLNAVDAAERGARVLTRTRCERLTRENGAWIATLAAHDGRAEAGTSAPGSASAGPLTVRARAVVNAAGPWVHELLDRRSPVRARHGVRLVKGSHIVVPRMFDHPYAYIFQNEDRRIIFAIPYEHDFTLIGTTDVEYGGDAAHVTIDRDEVAYLCELSNRYFTRKISPADVAWTYSGVRPLLDDESSDPSSVTRDYTFELDDDGAPILSVFGGKITTYRRLAEDAVDALLPKLGTQTAAWTAGAPLPGGDMPNADFERFAVTLGGRHVGVAPALLARYARAYGTRATRILEAAQADAQLGEAVLPGLHVAEIEYLRDVEFARTAEDILWRRSKLGLHLPRDAAATLDDWLARHPR